MSMLKRIKLLAQETGTPELLFAVTIAVAYFTLIITQAR